MIAKRTIWGCLMGRLEACNVLLFRLRVFFHLHRKRAITNFSLFVAIGAIFGVSTDNILIFLIFMRFHRLWYLHFVFYRSLFKPVIAISAFPQMELLIEQ